MLLRPQHSGERYQVFCQLWYYASSNLFYY